MKLSEFCSFLDEYLKVSEFSDVSVNGLQVEGESQVERVAFAVDACMESFKAAKKCGADVLVVHHGIVWGGINRIAGITKRRVEFLLKNNISLYAAHLPLDAHPEVGNNALLLRRIGCEPKEPFGEYRGVMIGFASEFDVARNVEELAANFSSATILPFGSEKVKRVAAVSGKGGFAVNEAIEKGVELLITGEAEHEVYHVAREGGLNVMFLGHYESEKLGVAKLAEIVAEKLGLDTIFIDVPVMI